MVGAACAGVTDDGATSTGALEVLPPPLATIAKELEAGMFRCPERVWPGIGATYGGAQVLLASRTANHAFLNGLRRDAQPHDAEPPRDEEGR